MLRFKPDVRIGYFSARVGAVLQTATVWSLKSKVDVRVNSIHDPAPARVPESLHPFDLAIDLGCDTNETADRDALAEYLRRWLPPQYDVILEVDHVHVEWDAHRRPLRRTMS